MTSTVLLISDDQVLKLCLQEYLQTDYTIVTNSEKNVEVIILDEPQESHLQKAHQQFPHALLVVLLPQEKSLDFKHFPVKFLEKPFALQDLKKSLTQEDKSSVLVIGNFKLYPSKRRLVHSVTQAIEYLTEKEVDILSFLYHHPNQLFSKEELLKQIWNYGPTMTTHTLETHIYRLRQKLTPDLLVNQEKGYSLCL
ncbi:MAG: winged helix-turn-helix domain-containing protein [Alphaproteobacteria bacterium]